MACILKIYRTFNPTARFSKYEFNYKLLNNIILFRVIPGVKLCNFTRNTFFGLLISLKFKVEKTTLVMSSFIAFHLNLHN